METTESIVAIPPYLELWARLLPLNLQQVIPYIRYPLFYEV